MTTFTGIGNLFAVGNVRSELLSACTGQDITPEDIMKTGERIFNQLKAHIVRGGLIRKEDDWPERFYRIKWGSAMPPKKNKLANQKEVA